MNFLKELQKKINYEFKNPELLENALTHSSFSKKKGQYYERLEFLGDRVLGLVIAEYLYTHFPNEKEGDLAKRLAALVRKESCAYVTKNLDIGQYIRISKAEEDSGGRVNPSLLGDICEALIAAIYVDGGLHEAKRFIVREWKDLFHKLKSPPLDNKSALQEWAQKRGYNVPEYILIEETGPEHKKSFLIEAKLHTFPKKTGFGRSKKLAEQAAAKALLHYVKNGFKK